MSVRPRVAVLSNSLTPYRLHFHRRVIAELSVELWSLFTHVDSSSPWMLDPPADINPVQFGAGEPSQQQDRLRFAAHEWRKGGRVIRWLREHQIDAVVVIGYNDPCRLRVLRWCHANGMPAFIFADSNVRGDRSRGWKGRLKRWLLPRVLRWCSGVLLCGSLGMEYFARYGLPRARMFLMPYEPDYRQIQSITASEIENARQHFGLETDRQRILYCGRLVAHKRVDLLVDAFVQIADKRSNWDLVIVGDGPLRQSLATRVPAKLVRRVAWLGFQNDQAAIGALYRLCAVLVLPSDYEPWGVVVNEAVAAGLAIVASDAIGAAAELVGPGRNGLIFPQGDGAALGRCLLEVTEPSRCAVLRTGAARQLADWRQRADPVRGLEAALASCGLVARQE